MSTNEELAARWFAVYREMKFKEAEIKSAKTDLEILKDELREAATVLIEGLAGDRPVGQSVIVLRESGDLPAVVVTVQTDPSIGTDVRFDLVTGFGDHIVPDDAGKKEADE